MLRIEPDDPIERMDPAEPIDRIDPAEPRCVSIPAFSPARPSSAGFTEFTPVLRTSESIASGALSASVLPCRHPASTA
jgi:hypothetical protein